MAVAVASAARDGHKPAMAKPNARAVALDLLQDVLRHKKPLDEALAAHPAMARLDARAVADARRLGACQLLFLGTPPHAAVGETVELVAGLGALAGYKGLANA